jgi:hypothetical protein
VCRRRPVRGAGRPRDDVRPASAATLAEKPVDLPTRLHTGGIERCRRGGGGLGSFRLAWPTPNLRHRAGRSGCSVLSGARRTAENLERPTAQRMSQPRRHRTGFASVLGLSFFSIPLWHGAVFVRARACGRHRRQCQIAVIGVTRLNPTKRSASNLKCANQRGMPGSGTLGGDCRAAMSRPAPMALTGSAPASDNGRSIGKLVNARRPILAGPRLWRKKPSFFAASAPCGAKR